MDDDDAVLGEGKVGVTLPAELVRGLVPVLERAVVRRQVEAADVSARAAAEDHDLALVCCHQELAVQVQREVARPLLKSVLKIF